MRRLGRGQQLYAMGDEAAFLYGLAEGALAAEAAPRPGTDRSGEPAAPGKLCLLHPGSWVSQVSTLDGRRFVTGVCATRPSALIAIPASAVRRMADEDPALWRWLLDGQTVLAERVLGIATDLMIRDSRGRTIAILLRLADHDGETTPDDAALDLTQDELASMVNLSRSVLSPILQQLQREGLISLGRGAISILDAERMAAELR